MLIKTEIHLKYMYSDNINRDYSNAFKNYLDVVIPKFGLHNTHVTKRLPII